ncbi:MAG: DUF3667 domain-containing protein [Saprospiraceae bacterium]|nr:DUF3667 domain-containing protein [Saprospiraceae bacterium]
MERGKHPDHCPNCNKSLSENDVFCVSCGQKTDAHLLSVRELFSNFWNSVFNFDNTLFNTLKYIWLPWKLTKFYVQGQRRSFLNPMRLFLITLLFHFGVILSIINIDNDKTQSNKLLTDYERSKIFGKYLDVKNKLTLDNNACVFADSLEHAIFDKTVIAENDTLLTFQLLGLKYRFTKKDILEIPLDSVYVKYNITKFSDKLLVQQYIRVIKDQAGTSKYLIGNFAWGILLVIIVLAGFMKLVYFQLKKHFVEHLVFLMNIHSLCFLINSIFIFVSVKLQNGFQEGVLGYLFIFPILILIFSMYFYYQQGIFKTFVKFCILGMAYMFLIAIFLVFISIISLLIY